MTTEEMSNPTATVPEAPPSPVPPRQPPKGKRRRKAVKRIVTVAVVLLVIAAIAFAMWFFVFREKKEEGKILSAMSQIGTIQSTVSGYGSARAGASAAVSVTLKGVIQEVYVNVGDVIFEGMPLYSIYSPDAATQVQKAQEDVDNAQKELDSAQKAQETAQRDLEKYRGDAAKLNITAPFGGKLLEVQTITRGQMLDAGTPIATLVNDRQMRLTLYFSYAYENDIYAGQSVNVSVPALMLVTQGSVEGIYKVDRISAEGGVFFEVDILVPNPGTLTEGMDASASMVSSSGVEIYPYENAKLSYSETAQITASLPGEVNSIGSLRDYMNVNAGEVLLTQSQEAYAEQLESMEESVESAQKRVADCETRLAECQEALYQAQQAEQNSEVVSPISGTVTSCAIVPDQEVEAGTTVITVSDTSVMTVQINVDDRNISYINPGMEVELTDWNGNYFIGTVTKIDIEGAQIGMGMSTYPVTLSVENMSGLLQQGMGLDYSFVTSESVDCVTVPIQCVKSIVDTDGNPQKVVFVKADEKPANAVEFDMPEYYGEYPPYPSGEEGYWPIPVETGLSDRYNLEITSGLDADTEIFNAYMMTGAYSY